jgi:hypothetical protein
MTKDAELERLLCAPGRDVLVSSDAYEPEPRAESLSKALGVITRHGQATRLFRTFRSECRDNRMPARLERLPEPGKISCPVRPSEHEVERRAIVPDVISPRWLPSRDVSYDPLDALGSAADPRPDCGKRCRRQI